MNIWKIAWANVKRSRFKSALLILLLAVITSVLFGGSVFKQCLTSGLESLVDRLGADIIVLPNDAESVSDFQDILLDSGIGYFYFDDDVVSKLANFEGVTAITNQLYLASTSASCCSEEVQIIGYNPDTDFIVKPWIAKQISDTFSEGDIVVGYGLNLEPGSEVKFFDIPCHVVAQLQPTGTSYDYCVFTTNATIEKLIQGSIEKKLNKFDSIEPDKSTSCVMIKVDPSYNVDEVAQKINILLPDFKAISNSTITKSTAKQAYMLIGLANFIMAFAYAVFAILLAICYLLVFEGQRREFAVYKMIGFRVKDILHAKILESIVLALLGSLIGVDVVMVGLMLFRDTITSWFTTPVLIPSAHLLLEYAGISVLVTLVTCVLTSIVFLVKDSKIEVSALLRG